MMRLLAVPPPAGVPSTGELVRDRLATLKRYWVALGRPVLAGCWPLPAPPPRP